MIVKCEQCETRFKIPDEKVTEKGVKVRCTKCQHTFRVVREETASSVPAAAVAPAMAAPVPPVAGRPTVAARAGTPGETPRPAPPASRPVPPGVKPARPAALDAPRPPTAAPPGLAPPRMDPSALPRVIADPSRTPATLELDQMIELMGDAGLGDSPRTPALSLSFDESDPFASVEPAAAAPRPAAPRPVAVAAPRGAPAPKPAPGLAPPVPFQVPTQSPPAPVPPRAAAKPAPPVPFQVPTRSPPAPVPARSAAPVPVSYEEPDPFSLPSEAPSAPAPRAAAPVSYEEPDPFSLPASPAPVYEEMEGLEGNNPFMSFTPPPPEPPPAPPVAAAPAGGFENDNPFAAFDATAMVPAPSEPSGVPDWGAPQQAPPSGIPDWGAPQQAPPSGIPDWDAPAQQSPPSGIPDWGAAPQGSAPAVPDWGSAQQGPPPGMSSPFADFREAEGEPSGRQVLTELPPEPPAPPPPVRIPPPVVAEPEAARPGPGLLQRLVSVAVQFVVLVVLVAGLLAVTLGALHEGKVELSSLSVASLREWLSPTRPLVATDVSNGLYESNTGKPLFFVRGEAVNRGATPTFVKVRVSLFEGTRRVLSAEGLAGQTPTPEELHQVQDAGSAAALRKRLDAGVQSVAPGARVPFVIFFHEYPENLPDLRLEVSLELQDMEASTGNLREGSAGNAQP
ncbi:MAG: zinc-ribbon domain-containing protein [Cystobacter sp.]